MQTNPTIGNEFQFQGSDSQLQSNNSTNILNIADIKKNNPTIVGQSQFVPYSQTAWSPLAASNTNIGPEYFTNFAANIVGNSIRSVTGITNTLIPTSDQISGDGFLARALRGTPGTTVTPYQTLKFDQLHSIPGVKYSDFRSRLTLSIDQEQTFPEQASNVLSSLQAHGSSAAIRGSYTAGAYAAASVTPAGAYSVFNRTQTYGVGEHDDPTAVKIDFTARTNITTRWKPKSTSFVTTINPLELALPFRGDRVNAVDYDRRNRFSIYRWKPTTEKILGIDIEKANDFLGKFAPNLTQDFIKFYFTGPTLSPGSSKDTKDDVLAFRAIITSLDDSFNADWNSVQMIGRADPNYHYGSYSRGGSLSFDVYATDRDELKPIYRKLNALASYTAPIYDTSTIAMVGPWMRLTVGDIHNQQPIVLTSVTFTYSFDDPWEINIEQDPQMMQVPFKVSVTCNFNIVGNHIPQNNGRILSLAKRYSSGSSAITGNDNWLSDFESNVGPAIAPVETSKSDSKRKQRRSFFKDENNGETRADKRDKWREATGKD